MTRRSLTLALAAASLLLEVATAGAQSFGQNSVQYHHFDFKVLSTKHFDIYYYEEEAPAAAIAARMAERWYARHSRVLGMELPTRQPVILYAAHPEFEETNVLFEHPEEGTGGETEFLKRRIVAPFAGPLGETDHVIGHELVHAFQYAAIGGTGPIVGTPPGADLPLWFMEGMAEYLSLGPNDPQTAMWLRSAALSQKKLPKISDLNDPKYFPYRWGQALWAYAAGQEGDEVVGRILKRAANGNAISAFEAELGAPIDSISARWQRSIREAYGGPAPKDETTGAEGTPAIVTAKKDGDLNLGPSLSPDGRGLVFFSERGVFSIGIYLADGSSGEVKQKLSSSTVDPHFQSLEFLQSSGAWPPDGGALALAAVAGGNPVLAFIRASDGKEAGEAKLPGLDEVFNPSYSPDGTRVVFAANAGGLLDLYTYDLKTRTLDRLTNDAYAELDPAWSPDGREIVFETDRFTSSLDSLQFGPMRLAVIDPGTRQIRELGGIPGAKNINPQWSPDGRAIYFLSNPDGASNVYRMTLATGEITEITHVRTGVEGITELSPAITVAKNSGRMVMTVFNNDRYELHRIDAPDSLAGTPPPRFDPTAALLPGAGTGGSEVAGFLESPEFLPPHDSTLTTQPYHPHLSLDYIGQPTLEVGTDPLGTYVGGGVSFFFSDMLGNHRLGTAIQVNGDAQGFGGVASYEDLASRWNWGASLGRIPYTTASYASGTGTVGGQAAEIQQTTIDTEAEYEIAGATSYPFSQVRRVEFNAAIDHLTFSRQVETQAWSLASGDQLLDEIDSAPAPGSLTLFDGGAALVYDSSIFGATSPVVGRRYRLEVDPTFGDLRYTGILGDVRQYVMPFQPVTLAGRLLHYGRYGRDATSDHLDPLFLGYTDLVRGYSVNSLGDADYGRLVGSRILVANFEVRAPLFRLFGSRSYYGPLPLEIAGFWDGGYAWDAGETPRVFGGARDGVSSAGAAARLNVGGYVVLELDYVKPLVSPGTGWHWQFDLTPGF